MKTRNFWVPRASLVLTMLLALTAGHAAETSHKLVHATRSPAAKSEPLPTPDEVSSKVPSADAAVSDMWVSHPYDTTDPKAHPGADLLAVEPQAIEDFLHGKGQFARFKNIPASRKGLVLRRYEEGDAKVTDLLIEAHKLGLKRSLLITDLNTSLKGTFKKGEKHNSDFEDATPTKSSTAVALKKLLEAGLKYNDLNHGIVSQPLYDGGMIPIMHNKDLFFIVYAEDGSVQEVVFFTGTNNMTDNPRYNRMYHVVEQNAARYVLENALSMAETFAKGGEIKDVKSKPPLKIDFPDGSSAEIAFTDGKFNPNDRMQQLLEQSAADPTKIKMHRATFSEFVFTDGPVIEALRSAMKANPDMTVFANLDDKFLAFDEYGKGEALAGYSTAPPFGKSTFGFSSDLRKRIEAYGYQRKVDGRDDTDPEGPPTSRHLWHDKTSAFEYEEDGKTWIEVHTGSFNLSTNSTNAELQIKFRMPGDSPFGRMVLESIVKPTHLEKEFAIPLEVAVFRNFLGEFTRHSIFEFDIDDATKIMEHLRAGKNDDALDGIRAIAKSPTKLKSPVPQKDLLERVKKLEAFFEWSKKNAPEATVKGISPQRFAAAAYGAAHPDGSAGRTLQLLKSALYSKDLTDADLEKRAREAMKVLGIKPPTKIDSKSSDDGEPGADETGRHATLSRAIYEGNVRGSLEGPNCKGALSDPGFKPE